MNGLLVNGKHTRHVGVNLKENVIQLKSMTVMKSLMSTNSSTMLKSLFKCQSKNAIRNGTLLMMAPKSGLMIPLENLAKASWKHEPKRWRNGERNPIKDKSARKSTKIIA